MKELTFDQMTLVSGGYGDDAVANIGEAIVSSITLGVVGMWSGAILGGRYGGANAGLIGMGIFGNLVGYIGGAIMGGLGGLAVGAILGDHALEWCDQAVNSILNGDLTK